MTAIQQPFWHTPAVRHLAWLCQTPSLIKAAQVFHPSHSLPADISELLRQLDEAPAPLLASLEYGQSRRLGQYFENLYGFFLTNILGWQVLLRNEPIRADSGRTLGELDYVVRNPASGRLQHHEIAVKFYLGLRRGEDTLWHGPNARDRLDLKSRRILDHQSTMTHRPETLARLASHGLEPDIEPVLFMPGGLFYPEPPLARAHTPSWVNPAHQRDRWCRQEALSARDTSDWVPLIKPHWLGRYQCAEPPAPEFTARIINEMAEQQRPGLFARMAKRPDNQGYDEVERYFVVPGVWPALR
ncbi:MAG: DUF1853 family protein [Oleiphilaceae bacterium]|nr:DUF1853 family protein [Oleiphilaceae bacterium]